MLFKNNNSEFLNKKIIVTGASSGIGLSVSIYFLNCGAQVILAGRDSSTMKKICQKYKFKNATIMKFDLSQDKNITDFKASIVEHFQTIDILVNCAGIKCFDDIEKTHPKDFDYTLDINLRSVYYLIFNLVGFMNKNSSIINLSCLYGSRPIYGMMSYSVSKAGLESFTKYAAAEFAPLGIRINAISSGPVDTNSLRCLNLSEKDIEDYNEKMNNLIPLGRIAKPDDIAKAVIFLASERSKRITGHILKVDGGRSLTSSGYVHYKGLNNMNVRFEPDNVNAYYLAHDLISPIAEIPPTEENELINFIENKMNESYFSNNAKLFSETKRTIKREDFKNDELSQIQSKYKLTVLSSEIYELKNKKIIPENFSFKVKE